jgi:BirA family transcriptional regulator, biotin operon repressor / biotin---[acetyl-CoA-carboxylase] ligase
MTSATRRPYRAPLSEPDLQAAVLPGSRLFSGVRVIARTGSTNADLLAAAAAGAPAGAVLAAEEQTSGRGRLDRSWQSEPGAALTFSVLLRPAAVPAASRGWLPLLTGVAVATALRARTGLDVSLKWPNDVLCGGAKLAGILIESLKLETRLGLDTGLALAVGIGVNCRYHPSETSYPATDLAALGVQVSAGDLFSALSLAMMRRLDRWRGGEGFAAIRADWLDRASGLGEEIQARLPGRTLVGRFEALDENGCLLLRLADGSIETIVAGDVFSGTRQFAGDAEVHGAG